MWLGLGAPLASDYQNYLTVAPSEALVNWEINRIQWSTGDGSALFDAGWRAKAAGHAHATLNVCPLIGPQSGTPLLNSGSGQTLSPWNPAGAAVPTTMTLTDVAAGVWDGLYTTAFANIAGDLPTATLRIGAEMYGPGWYPHCGIALGYQMQAAFRHLVTLARSVNSGFTFEWNGAYEMPYTSGYMLADMQNFYPGDSYVDYISGDMYDVLANAPGAPSWADVSGRMVAPMAFAKAHGKPYCITEFGLQNFAQTGAGNNDDPDFLAAAHAWGRANAGSLGWMSLFNNPPGGYGDHWDGCLQQNPQSAAVFKALFGQWARELAAKPGRRFVTPGFGQVGAIKPIGNFAHAKATGLKTLAVSPSAVGNVLVLAIINVGIASVVSAVSGGGVTTWTKIVNANPGAAQGDTELWYGAITTTGPATITKTDLVSSNAGVMGCQEFTIGTPATWAVDTSAASTSITSDPSGTYPSVTPAGRNELYVGAANLAGGVMGGSSTGFVYLTGSFGGFEPAVQFVYNTAANTPTAQAPAWTQASGPWSAVAALITALPVTAGAGAHRQRLR